MGIICVAEAQDIDLPPLDPSVFIDSPKVTPIPSEQSSDPIPVAEEPDDLILPQPKSLTPSTQPSSSSRVERIPVAEEVPAAQLPPSRQAAQVPVIPKVSSELVEQNRTQVAVLGYHDFSEEKPVTEMRIRTSVFRRQMQALKDAGMPIITMKEFWEWKNGDRKLPEFCILITIDDGWKSVYTDAFPILKEMGFPFTLFPYTHYLTGRGASLSISQVQEMKNYGASIGSHSTSHFYPSTWKKTRKKGEEAYLKLIDQEIGASREWLLKNFGEGVDYYCYPGGYHTPEMIEKLPTYGFQGAFTVIPRKTLKETDNWQLPRYMVFGNNPSIFARGVTFTRQTTDRVPDVNHVAQSATGGVKTMDMPAPVQPVLPVANSVTQTLCPTIAIVLSSESNIDPNSLQMFVTGYGKVPAKFNPNNQTLSWEVNRPIRSGSVTVLVKWKNAGEVKSTSSATWQFGVQQKEVHYLPSDVVQENP
jgi:peptidoglycan/xylan/chitin deacetylase (PgdA/CDA1 family)